MSNVGQAALVIVGTVVGAYFGQPGLGLAIGSLVGSALFPTQLPAGPRITDNRTTTATVGEPVPILFGTASLSGTVIDLLPYTEISTETGGKGGPEQQTFSYTQTIAIGLCERVDDTAAPEVGAISGISRIWENGTIVYDIRPQQPADTATGALAETDQDYANRLAASAAYASTFVLYLGDELQDPDPTLEAYHGIGNVPGFRGLAYVVYPDRQLTIAQGLRHPNFTFECYQYGTGQCTDQTKYSQQVLYPWTDSRNSYTYTVHRHDAHGANSGPDPQGNVYNDLNSALDACNTYTGRTQNTFIGYEVPAGHLDGSITVTQIGGTAINPPTVDPNCINQHYNFNFPVLGPVVQQVDPNSNPASFYAISGDAWWQTGSNYITTAVPDADFSAFPPWDFPYTQGSRWTNFWWYEQLDDTIIQVTRSPSAPTPPCFGLPPATIPGYALNTDGTIVKCNDWVVQAGDFHVLQSYAATTAGTNYKSRYPLNPCVPNGDPNYTNETFWVAAYTAAVAAGQMAAGLTYGTDYPLQIFSAYSLDLVICQGSGAGASVASIIQAICKRAGLAEAQIDVSDLNAIEVPGYSISSISNGADIIAPLRSIAFFDAVESGTVLRFPTRGKAIVATLTEDDFGCYDGGDGTDGSSDTSNIPPAITTVRTDQTTLPRSIRLHYKAVSRDYEDGEADSPFRLTTKAVDDQDVSLPLCLGDVQAAQAAQVLWADAWSAESAHELSVDQAWLQLEAGDCIAVPIRGVLQRIRIVSDSNASAVLRKLSCVRDDGGSYISFATATAPQRIPQKLTFIDATADELMDLPALQDSDNDPGFYVAAQRANDVGGSWRGCTLYKSVDSGITFQSLFSLLTEATVGTLYTELPPSQAWTWDDVTIITVDVASSAFTFESRTDEAVLNGANAAAIGADARWEIVQFANAEQISPTRWELSRLLRGRRGTEHVIGSSRAGDALVMLSTGDLNRVILQTSEIGATRVYRATSIGASFSSGVTQGFVGRGMALKPFSPVRLIAKRETGGDIVISWIRRNRLGRTLMSGVILPMSEATLAFQIDIIDPTSPASPEVVMRTLTSSSASVRYTAAEQHADFGSPLPGTVKVAVYQMSAVVGRGFPAIEVLTVE